MRKILKQFLAFCIITLVPFHAFSKTYNLDIAYKFVNITGNTVKKIGINGTIPGPILRFEEGEEVTINVINNLDEDTSIHWHGLLLPGEMDGVPGLNGFPGIKPGETFTYRFKIRQTGTYWYHSHSKGQEQDGEFGALIIDFKDADPVKFDRDYVILLSDFHEENGSNILANLKMSSEYYQYARRTLTDFFYSVEKHGFRRAWENALMWGKMRMLPTDLADVTGYTFLTNGKTSEQNWTGLFKLGERIRLRFINASAMSFFDVRIPGLEMHVVSSDGQNIEPINVDEFRFGVAETYDVIVIPQEEKAYTIVAEPIDRTGFALSTLSPRLGLKGEIPVQRERALLTMKDMSMNHEMNHEEPMDHTNHEMSHEEPMDHIDDLVKEIDEIEHDHSSHANHEMSHEEPMESGWAKTGSSKESKTLNYSDLRYLGIQKDARKPDREIVVRLGGNMERYIWTLNDKKFRDSEPINLKYGERVRLKFINDTMMAHPMHLHGMFFQLENGQPLEKLPNKNMVIVAPGNSYSVLLSANEPGEWAFHCHLLYHMMAGMMNKVVVAKLDATADHANHEMNHEEPTLQIDTGNKKDNHAH